MLKRFSAVVVMAVLVFGGSLAAAVPADAARVPFKPKPTPTSTHHRGPVK